MANATIMNVYTFVARFLCKLLGPIQVDCDSLHFLKTKKRYTDEETWGLETFHVRGSQQDDLLQYYKV